MQNIENRYPLSSEEFDYALKLDPMPAYARSEPGHHQRGPFGASWLKGASGRNLGAVRSPKHAQ